jgi:hypothetical protein
MELRVAPARGLRREEAEKRRSWLPAAALAVVLVPSALGAPPPQRPSGTLAPEPLPEPDPTRLALAPRDLLADALRIEVGPGFEHRAAAPPPVSSPPPEPPSLLGGELVLAAAVPEPPAAWLALLSLASAAVASRGMRRCPRRRRHR